MYFYLENNSLILKLKEQFVELKEVQLNLTKKPTTKFEYFEAVSTLASCIFVILLFLRSIYKADLFSFYESLDFHEQHFIIVSFVCFFLITAVGSILNLLASKTYNNSNSSKSFYILKGECILRIVIGMFFSFLCFDYLSKLPETPSTLGIANYRIYFGLGYTWISAADFRIAEEYRLLSRGCTPPLLQTMEVDGLTTSNRIQLLKLLNAEHSLAFSNVMSNTESLEELLDFTNKQNLEF
jgi:hypothetical protein